MAKEKKKSKFSVRRKFNAWFEDRVNNALGGSNKAREEFSIDGGSRMTKLHELYCWYLGDSFKLLSFYGRYRKSIYGTKKDYFWSRAYGEDNKKTHSGLPSMILDVLVNVQGIATITAETDEIQSRLDEILEFNNFEQLIKHKETPIVLGLGGGCFKFAFDLDLSPYPFILFVDDRNIEYEYAGSVLIAITFLSKFTYKNKEYTKKERYDRTSISFTIFDKNGKEVSPTIFGDLADQFETLEHDFGKIMAVPVRFKADKENSNLGRSIFDTKIDLFDDLDQSYSIMSEQTRLSTPLEYHDASIMDRDSHGRALPQETFKRKVLKRNMTGQNSDPIVVSQPNINVEAVKSALMEQFLGIIAGIISPATLGMETSRDANATAQREKEKVTFFTRDDMIDNQEIVLAEVLETALMLQDFIDGKAIGEYEINVSFPEFANPSFEEIITTFYPILASSGISEEMYVEKVYGNSLGDKEKAEEILRLKTKASTSSFEDLENDFSDDFDKKKKAKQLELDL